MDIYNLLTFFFVKRDFYVILLDIEYISQHIQWYYPPYPCSVITVTDTILLDIFGIHGCPLRCLYVHVYHKQMKFGPGNAKMMSY
jgi:hypothetical protein